MPARGLARVQELDLRLRVVWGWGAPRYWQGEFSVSDGQLLNVQPLGLEADEPGSFPVSGDTVSIYTRSPRSYDGFDVSVRAPEDATVRLSFSIPENHSPKTTIEVPLNKLIGAFHNETVEGTDSRAVIQRSPGDTLRLESDRDSLVFEPGDTWPVVIRPHLAPVSPGGTYRLHVKLTSARSSKALWQQSWTLRADEQGRLEPVQDGVIQIPEEEGAYDAHLTISRSSALRNPFRAQPLVTRRVQLIAVRSDPFESRDSDEWGEIANFNPAQSRWFERLRRLPQLTLLPGVEPGPLGNDKSSVRSYQNRQLTQIATGGWKAFPLPIRRVDAPHVVEIEYPRDIAQTMGVSIVEPQTDGTVSPVGVDSGIDVRAEFRQEPGLEKFQLTFWPRTESPYLLITNRGEKSPAMFGAVRVLGGPVRLPPNPVQPLPNGREMIAHFDRPLFPEIFSASQAVDPGSGRGLDDWQTFYEGAIRLVTYLRHVGYSGACVTVYCEGSTIYPSALLEPTPKYDSGIYFGTGQDLFRKDVLELLFRLFDRNGLKLVPSLQFTTPLPALSSDDSNTPENTGVLLVGPDGKAWTRVNHPRRGMAPYYNPLNDRVQRAVLDVVDELVRRYGHHDSFSGLSLDLSPDGYLHLPGPEWGIDSQTVDSFTKRKGVQLDQTDARRRVAALTGKHRERWIAWRAEVMTQFYREIQKKLVGVNPSGQLYLSGADLVDAPPVQRALWPALPQRARIEVAIRELGIDAPALRESQISLLRPRRLSPSSHQKNRPVHLQFNESEDVDKYFSGAESVGQLAYHETHSLRLEQFDLASPFGPENTFTRLYPRFTSNGPYNRQRFIHALVSLDSPVIFDGGWTVAFGQEHTYRPIFDTFRRLPKVKFSKACATSDIDQPVVVRECVVGERKYLYLLNNSPWQVQTKLRLGAIKPATIEWQGGRIPAVTKSSSDLSWTLALEPFDLIAGILSPADATVERVETSISDEDRQDLEDRIASLGARVSTLRRDPSPVSLVNPNFEATGNGRIPGWTGSVDEGASVSRDDTDPSQGFFSLRMESTGRTVWLRSDVIPVPKTGRVTMRASIRSIAAGNATLRMSIQGTLFGRTFYRWRSIGGSSTDEPLTAEWKEFEFRQELPLEGLENLRIGFDLMGPGVVWIDEVRLNSLEFSAGEQQELNFIVAELDQGLRQKRYADCLQNLNRFWPRYLEEHVTAASQVAHLQRWSDTPRPSPPSPTKRSKKDATMLDRVKRIFPRWRPF